jgi:hypothetical protein
MQRLLPLVILVVGCYSPTYKSPGYYCHEDDRPACPGDQVCVSGRCQNKGTVKLDGGARDMSGDGGSMGDMKSNADMKTVNPAGCATYAECLENCTTAACQTACDNAVAAAGAMLYDTALGCGQNYCINAPRSQCRIDTTGTMLIDNGTPVGKCNTCLVNALALLFGNACNPPTNIDCNPSSCLSSYNACLAD